jgi:hypothetical protein
MASDAHEAIPRCARDDFEWVILRSESYEGPLSRRGRWLGEGLNAVVKLMRHDSLNGGAATDERWNRYVTDR